MLDENIWMRLNQKEKILELQNYLNELILIDEGKHELSNTQQQGKIPSIKKEIHEKIFKIIELENAL